MADDSNVVTDHYWWSDQAWNDLTVELVQNFRGGAQHFKHAEFMMEYARAAAEGDVERGQSHLAGLAPTSGFLCRTQSALGDCLIDVSAGKAWYQQEKIPDSGSSSPQFNRWFHNFTKAHYASVTILPSGLPAGYVDYTKFGDRAVDLMQSADWSEAEASRLVVELLKVLWNWPLSTQIDDWEEAVRERDIFEAPPVHWAPLLSNPHFPVGEASRVYDVLATNLIEHLRGVNFQSLGSEQLLALLSCNPNTPSKYVHEAYNIAAQARSSMDRLSSEYNVRSQIEALDRHMDSLWTHPNGPAPSEAQKETAAHFPDNALFSFFSNPKEKMPSASFLAHLARELMTNPAREDVLRRIFSHLFANEDAIRLALLLPAVGAVLHEFNDAFGDSSEEVPFEWLMAAMG